MVGDKKLNIKIITTAPYPIGMANSSRIHAYAKGLLANNCDVSVFCIKPTEKPGKVFNQHPTGEVEGVRYRYLSGATTESTNFFLNSYLKISGVFNLCKYFITERKDQKTDAIIFYSYSNLTTFLLFFISRYKNIVFLKEMSEFPSVHAIGMNPIKKLIFTKIHFRLFDGMLVMTNRLMKYFKEEKKIDTNYLLVPMTVDTDRFEKSYPTNDKLGSYIAYCGTLNDLKDGVNILLEAFCVIAKRFPEINLVLIGDPASKEEGLRYKEIIQQNQLEERVIMTGRISKDEIPKFLCNAKVLVLPRPNSLQAEGGFPTKLGEYLATGKPVLVTRVGEIDTYLTDKKDSFIAEPGSISSLINNLSDILNDYDFSLEVGKNGKKAALLNFNPTRQAKEIIRFVESIKLGK